MAGIAVYCAYAWRFSTRITTGIWPLTSPPLTAGDIDMAQLKAPIIYIRLHGLPGQPFFYGDPGRATALSASQVRATDFAGSLVFLEGCYGAEMAEAFLDAGARAVTGSGDATWGRAYRLGPSSKVGRAWLQSVRRGEPVRAALKAALNTVKIPYRHAWAVQGDAGAKLL